MPLEWNGSRLRRCRTMSLSTSNATSRPFGRRNRPISLVSSTSGPAAAGSTVSGSAPVSPSTTALTLPCPCPVAPSEPNSSTRIPATRSSTPSSASDATNMPAARIGPTVCELDGPIPILKRSNALTVTARSFPRPSRVNRAVASGRRAAADPLARRVERRAQGRGRRPHLSTHIYPVGAGPYEFGGNRAAAGVADIGEADRRPQRRPPRGRGHLAHRYAVAQHQFPAPHHRVRVGQHQRNQPPPWPLGPGLFDRLPAEERDIGAELAREHQPGLHRAVFRRQFLPERPVPLFQ